MDSKEFLDSLVGKEVWIEFKDGANPKGVLVWNDLETIGVKYINESVYLYYKHSIRSIRVQKSLNK